jgi:integrase
MSVEKVTRKGGVVWRVRWRENGQARSQVVGKKRDAEALDAEIKRRKRLGQLPNMDAGKQSVADFARDEWWPLYVVPNLAARTQTGYAAVFDKHLLPRVGAMPLRDVTPRVIARLRVELEASGAGPAVTRKALVILQGIFRVAVEWGHVQSNPVAGVHKPSGKRLHSVVPPLPITVERMRHALLARGQMRDATLISVLAYGGLRPQEALALRWSDVRDRTLLVERAQSDGELKRTKTGQTRTVRLLAPLASDLLEWRMASGRPASDALVFPKRDGSLWRDHDWRNWRRRTFEPTVKSTGETRIRPYDLRHAFCSLLLHEGQTVVEVARQAGHSPTMTLSTYAHVMAEIEEGARLSAEDAIRAAREGNVSGKCPDQRERKLG